MLPNADTSAGAHADAGLRTLSLAGLRSIGLMLAGLMAAAASAQTGPATNLGTVKAGSSATAAVTVTVATAGTPAQIKVVTQGIAGLDFTDAGGGSCAVGTPYAAGATCAVNVKFAPQYAGERMGAVMLADASGDMLGMAYVTGTGLAGQLGFLPGGSGGPVGSCGDGGVATDPAGNVYLTCSKEAMVFKVTPQTGGGWTETEIGTDILAQDGLHQPTGIAVDGAGNVFVADATQNRVVEFVPTESGYTQVDLPSISGLNIPEGLAVDAAGNLYIADYNRARIVKETPGPNGYSQAVLATGLNGPMGIAVDPNGNVFATSPQGSVVYEIPPGVEGQQGAQTFGSGFVNPFALGADALGNIYVTDSNGTTKWTPSGGSYSSIKFPTDGVLLPSSSPIALAVDGAGDVFFGGSEFTLTSPYLAYAGSAGSQGTFAEYGIFNTGNSPLGISAVNYPSSFPQGAPEQNDIYLPAGVTVLGECAAGMTVPVGQLCLVSATFAPTPPYPPYPPSGGDAPPGAFEEDVEIVSDARGGQGSPVNITLMGDVGGAGSLADVLLTATANPVVGQPVTLQATLLGQQNLSAGTISFYQTDVNGITATFLASAPMINGQASYVLTGLTAGTTYYFADFSGYLYSLPGPSQNLPVTVGVPVGVEDFGGKNLGSLSVNTSGSATPLTITFTATETLGGIAVLTQGAPNLDFQDAGGGTCKAGQSYAAGDTCSVNVVFKPVAPGPRYGAVVLSDGSGNAIGTGYIQGTGTGPQLSFPPGTATGLGDVPYLASGVAVDAMGNIFVAAGSLYKFTPGTGGYTQTVVPADLLYANAVAVDGSGSLFVTESSGRYSGSTSLVNKLTPTGSGYTQVQLGTGWYGPQEVAVDGAGNVFVVAQDPTTFVGNLYELSPSQGTYAQTIIPLPWNTGGLVFGIAVDGAGNLYATPGNPATVYKGTASNNAYTWNGILTGQSASGYFEGLAVDAGGDVFVGFNANGTGSLVLKGTPQTDGSYAVTQLTTPETSPINVTVDSLGNLYVAGSRGITMVDFADPPPLMFAETTKGSTSSDSPKTVTIENTGNAALTLTGVSYPADFPEASGAAADCKAGTVAQFESCTLTIDFTPQASGVGGTSLALSESVSLSGNMVNSKLNIELGGVENIPVNPTLAMAGTAVSLAPGATTGNTSTITVTPGGGFTGSVALTAAVTSSPQGAQDLPTVSFGSTSPVNIGGTSAATATMTIATTAASTSSLKRPGGSRMPWYGAGSVLACLLVVLVPRRRQGWRALAGMTAIALMLTTVASCGGGGANSGGGGGGGGGGGSIAGTTAGSYTITVTGTSGSVTTQCTVALTVQ